MLCVVAFIACVHRQIGPCVPGRSDGNVPALLTRGHFLTHTLHTTHAHTYTAHTDRDKERVRAAANTRAG